MAITVTIVSSGDPGAQSGLRRPAGVWLVAAACICALFACVFTSNHLAPAADWERVEATVLKQESVYERRPGFRQRMVWFVRENYLAEWRGSQIVCAWDDMVLPGFTDLSQWMVRSPDALTPGGSQVTVGLDPANRGKCMPDNGWNALSICEAVALFGLAALMAFAGGLLLRRPARAV